MIPGCELKPHIAWAPLVLFLVFLLQSTFLGHSNQRRPNHPNRRHQHQQNVIFVACETLTATTTTTTTTSTTTTSTTATATSIVELLESKCEHHELSQLLFKRFNYLFSQEERSAHLELSSSSPGECNSTLTGELHLQPSQPSNDTKLDQRTTANLSENNERQLLPKRRYFRVLNRVFSRVELPDTFKRAHGHLSRASNVASSQSQSPNSSSSISTSVPSNNNNNHCALHIGCIDELPNFPSLLKLKPNVSATFTVYSSSGQQNQETITTNEPRRKIRGQRIVYEPVMHYKLEESSLAGVQSDSELESEALKLVRQQQANKLTADNQLLMSTGGQTNNKNKPASLSRLNRRNSSNKNKMNGLRGGQQVSSSQELSRNKPNGSQLSNILTTTTTASNGWKSAVKIAHSLELPFDLSQLEQVNFNSSLTTRVIIGGYFAKEDEEWIDELVRQWLSLEPCNVIKVSWQDSNRGLYHTAAYNSRIVGRQLSLFLHYLNELHQIDLGKFHLVGHSLGAHIAGFVGQDNEARIARITGLDPAGPIFFELAGAWRLDPSDAQFVDVMHTNGGTITKGALGLAVPSGHVDYYCNGGSLQPGCYFSSVTKSIMDPVERVACNHRRSYRYFTELTKLAISTSNNSTVGSTDLSKFPQAFLFQVTKQDELVRLIQPELSLINKVESPPLGAPLRHRIEFHSLRPNFPKNKRGLYFFRTRSEAPFFSSRQFAITIRSEQLVKKKLALMAKINNSLVAEVELDELNGGYSFVFAPQDPNLIDARQVARGQVPDLWLMWRQRSFNLLLGQQNELYLSSIELNLIDDFQVDVDTSSVVTTTTLPSELLAEGGEESADGADQLMSSMARTPNTTNATTTEPAEDIKIVRYLNANSNQLDSILKTTSLAGHFALARNQWHKFEGKLEATTTSRRRRRKRRRR